MFTYYIVRPNDTLMSIALRYRVPPCLLLRINSLTRAADIRPGMRLTVPVAGFPMMPYANDDYALPQELTQLLQGDPPCVYGEDRPAFSNQPSQPNQPNQPSQPDIPDLSYMDMPDVPRAPIIPGIPPAPGVPEFPLASPIAPVAPPVPPPIAPPVTPPTAPSDIQPAMPDLPAGEYEIGQSTKFEKLVVKPGDTLYSLARRYGTTVSNLVIANSIRNPNLINVGQTLIIPVPPDNAIIYTVKPGDTIFRISRQLGVPARNIVDYNYLDRYGTIYPNMQLVIKRS